MQTRLRDWQLLLMIGLLLLAGAANGFMDNIQFHYGGSVVATWDNQDFWNPEQSWQRKWQRDPTGRPLRPLREAFPGSSTILVWTTDAWHLAKEIQYAAWRTILVLLLAWSGLVVRRTPWQWPLIWLVLWAIQAVGFHLTYSLWA